MSKKIEYKSENCDTITLDINTYMKIVRACISKYGNKSDDEACEIIKKSNFFNKENFPPKTYNQMALLDNETVYHMSMIALYGDNYWNHPNYEDVSIDDYYTWEEEFIEENNLNKDYIYYD